MTRNFIFFCILPILISVPSSAQQSTIKGRFLDSETRSTLTGVTVRLQNPSNSDEKYFAVSNNEGRFEIKNVNRRSYRLEATYIGYPTYKRTVNVDKAIVDLGTIRMRQDTVMMDEMVVEGMVPRAVQKGDTTEYSAQAFQTHKDATTEELVSKMPGVTVEGGTVKAQGEEVRRVLVDGRRFFGDDPTLALRNLPAEVVDRIQVFDEMSEQSRFSGFDDGQRTKAMNVITRIDRRNSQFGRLYAGYGTEDRYATGGTFNMFNGDQRVTLLGISNNVNQQNFSIEDILGAFGGGRGGGFIRRMAGGLASSGGLRMIMRSGGGRGGPSRFGGGMLGFFMGEQDGLTTTHSIGTNYSDRFGESLELQGSYFFNKTRNGNEQSLNREYFQVGQTGNLYDETNRTQGLNDNHRLNMRLEYNIDTLNSVMIRPYFSVQNNNSRNDVLGSTTLPTGDLLNSTASMNETQLYGYNLSSEVLYRHRFEERGRTISLSVTPGLNRRSGWSDQYSASLFAAGGRTTTDTLDQHGDILTDGYSIGSRLVYTEPISENSQLQVNYYGSYSNSSSDSRRKNFDPLQNAYTILDTTLTNTYDNEYTTHSAGLGYRMRLDDLNATIGISYQLADLKGNQTFPYSSRVDRTFYDFLPSANMRWRITQSSNLRFYYNTSTDAPSITQLQNVVDNSNPLQLSSGNPDLEQAYSHRLVANYSTTNMMEGKSMFLVLFVSATRDYIGNSTLTASRDTTLPSGLLLNAGTQYTIPVNLDGQWDARTFFTYGFPFEFIRSNINLNTGLNYGVTPGYIDGQRNVSDGYGISQGIVVSSNISRYVDFTVAYNASYNITKNSIQPELDQSYFSHAASLRSTITFWEGIVWQNDLTNTLYQGLGEGYDDSYLLWNMSLGKKFLENDRGEVKLSVYDLLGQNQSITRTVNELYLQDSRSQVLDRHYLLTLSYTIR